MTKNISNAQAITLIEKGAKIIDIRDSKEFWDSHIPGAFNISIDEIKNVKNFIYNKNENIIVICSHGVRSIAATEILRELGYTNAFNLANGYESFRKFKKWKVF